MGHHYPLSLLQWIGAPPTQCRHGALKGPPEVAALPQGPLKTMPQGSCVVAPWGSTAPEACNLVSREMGPSSEVNTWGCTPFNQPLFINM